MIRLPDLPEGFSPEFLTRLLRTHGALPGDSRVGSVRRSRVGHGTGMMAELARLNVTYEGDPGTAPPSFIAKYASRNATNRDIANRYRLPERETRYVAELDSHTDIRTPGAYFSGVDEDRFLILMEDMSEYEVGNQVDGASLEQSELAIDELAKLHGAFWDQVDDLDWVPGVAGSYHADNMRALADTGFDALLERFAGVVPAHLPHRRAQLLGAIETLQARMNQHPRTLCHGDFRMENLLYGCRPEHDPVAVLDWQGPLRGRGMLDVALFLGQSTRTELRRQHERQLLTRYVRGLEARGVAGLDPEAVWQDYRQSLLYSWVYAIVVAGALDSGDPRSHAWMTQMIARQAAACDDLDAYSLLPGS